MEDRNEKETTVIFFVEITEVVYPLLLYLVNFFDILNSFYWLING